MTKTNMKETFESFLQDWHGRDYMGTDDDMPDAFDQWLTELNVDDLINIADLFAQRSFILGEKSGLEEGRKIALSVLSHV